MRNIIFAYIILLCNGISSMYTQTDNLLTYLKSNDLKGFVQFCNKNDSLAIEKLFKYSLKDTISIEDIWYNETEGKNINPFERSIEGFDMSYASLKIKSYFWILQIFNSDYSFNKKKICIFYNSDNDVIFDYRIISRHQQNQKVKEIIMDKNQKVNTKYTKKSSKYLVNIDDDFKKWHTKIKKKGLRYLREKNIPPIIKSRYKVFLLNKL